MHFCYIDESGDSQALAHAADDKQVVLVIGALFVPAIQIKEITADFIKLKRQYYPKKFENLSHDLDVLTTEIKGSDIRTDIRNNKLSSKIVEHHFRFLDGCLALLKLHEVSLVGRGIVKSFGVPLIDKNVYTLTTQNICQRFQKYLETVSSSGVVVADFRDPARNKYVAHSVFTQKHKSKGGDAYPDILETSTFGMSNNHACLQLMDLICSAILSPMISVHCCEGVVTSCHTHNRYKALITRYRPRLKSLQFHYDDVTVIGGNKKIKRFSGVVIKNPHNQKNEKTLFS